MDMIVKKMRSNTTASTASKAGRSPETEDPLKGITMKSATDENNEETKLKKTVISSFVPPSMPFH